MSDALALPPGIQGTQVSAPVDTVLVLEDRAQVTRKGKVRLSPGHHRLVVPGVSTLITDRSLRTGFDGKPSGRIQDVRVRRSYVVRARRPEKEKEIGEAIRTSYKEYLTDLDRATALVRERELIGGAQETLGTEIRDHFGAGLFETRWKAELDQIWQRWGSVEAQLLDCHRSQEDRVHAVRRLEKELRAVMQPVTDYAAFILTDLTVTGEGEYTLTWDYQVPCALWRPEYTAELSEEDPPTVHWQSTGCVWQLTGEDWSGVRLSFSTARPTLGATPPFLQEEVLKKRAKTADEKKTIEVTSRDEEIAVTGTAAGPQAADTPPGLDDGGEARTFTAPRRVDIPSDGRPHRIEFETWEAKTKPELACIPELARYVFLRSVQASGSTLPLLAGPVALVRGGGFVGRSQIGFVAPQEEFALSWGSEDGVVVLRKAEYNEEEVGLRKQHVYDFKLRIHLVNQSGNPCKVKLTERIPVSEVKQVSVELHSDTTTLGFEKDAQGQVSWVIDLVEGAEKEVKVGFTVRMPHRVHWKP